VKGKTVLWVIVVVLEIVVLLAFGGAMRPHVDTALHEMSLAREMRGDARYDVAYQVEAAMPEVRIIAVEHVELEDDYTRVAVWM